MRFTSLWASAALACAPSVVAQGLRQVTSIEGATPASPVPWYPTPEPEESDCTATLITTLCDYKEPGPNFAVASSGKAHCWEYCNEHQPCDFVIFRAGNPYTGTGTCWLYPGEEFDESAGSDGCEALYVYDKPECATPSAGASASGTTASACDATASPSAIAEVCDYPTPDDDCWGSCSASSSSAACISQCVGRDSCTFAIFNPNNPSNSPHAGGSCWMYPSGEYDADKAGTCKGDPEQYVYENPCPKPQSPSSSSTSAAASASASPSSAADAKAAAAGDNGSDSDDEDDDDSGSAFTGVSFAGLIAASLAVVMAQQFR